MKGQLNLTKSITGDAFMPMVSVSFYRWLWRSLPMIRKENVRVADWSVVVS